MTKILRFPAVIERTGLCRSTINLKVSQGLFPKKVSLGANSIGWLESDIDNWINAKLSESGIKEFTNNSHQETLPLFESFRN